MSHRAKIAEWIKEAQEICDALECEDCPEAEKGTDRCRYAFYAEHLDWHGVVCRKEGRWIVKQVGAAEKQYICSECGNEENKKGNFCSICGADMRWYDEIRPLLINYAFVDKGHVEEIKETLLQQMIDEILQIAENDEFWIVKEVEGDPDVVTVGWQVHFPQMERSDDGCGGKDIKSC